MSGLLFEDCGPNVLIRHAVRRTVTETDNILVTTLTHNVQPLHLDAEAAAATEFGQVIVNSIFTFGLMVGVSVADTTLGTLVANLGYNDVTFPKPVFVGDTLRTETRVLETRTSKSRSNAGIVVFEHRSFNQRDELVARCTRTALLKRRDA
ncbi:MAG TPA: MaoC family dehydratase [Sphingomonadaceae bacterium]|jgi:acyl dehydratase|nr:MaoC family dehydratase [Sphingomonadaceae bacterium]